MNEKYEPKEPKDLKEPKEIVVPNKKKRIILKKGIRIGKIYYSYDEDVTDAEAKDLSILLPYCQEV